MIATAILQVFMKSSIAAGLGAQRVELNARREVRLAGGDIQENFDKFTVEGDLNIARVLDSFGDGQRILPATFDGVIPELILEEIPTLDILKGLVFDGSRKSIIDDFITRFKLYLREETELDTVVGRLVEFAGERGFERGEGIIVFRGFEYRLTLIRERNRIIITESGEKTEVENSGDVVVVYGQGNKIDIAGNNERLIVIGNNNSVHIKGNRNFVYQIGRNNNVSVHGNENKVLGARRSAETNMKISGERNDIFHSGSNGKIVSTNVRNFLYASPFARNNRIYGEGRLNYLLVGGDDNKVATSGSNSVVFVSFFGQRNRVHISSNETFVGVSGNNNEQFFRTNTRDGFIYFSRRSSDNMVCIDGENIGSEDRGTNNDIVRNMD